MSAGWTIALAVGLAFLFGYALSTLPLLKAGLDWVPRSASSSLPTRSRSPPWSWSTTPSWRVIPGAMDAGLVNPIFWVGMMIALTAAFLAAYPVNRYLLQRGKGHALTHAYHGGTGEVAGARRYIPSFATSTLAAVIVAFMLGGLVVSVASELSGEEPERERITPLARVTSATAANWSTGAVTGRWRRTTSSRPARILLDASPPGSRTRPAHRPPARRARHGGSDRLRTDTSLVRSGRCGHRGGLQGRHLERLLRHPGRRARAPSSSGWSRRRLDLPHAGDEQPRRPGGCSRTRGWPYHYVGYQWVVAWNPEVWTATDLQGVRLSSTSFTRVDGTGPVYVDSALATLEDGAGRTVEVMSYHLPPNVQVANPEPARLRIDRQAAATWRRLVDASTTDAVLFGGDDNVDETNGYRADGELLGLPAPAGDRAPAGPGPTGTIGPRAPDRRLPHPRADPG